QADAFQSADDLVGAGGGEVQPFAHGGHVDDGVVEQAVHHALAVGRSAAQPFRDAGTERFTHAQDGGGGPGGFAADADHTFQEEAQPAFPVSGVTHGLQALVVRAAVLLEV